MAHVTRKEMTKAYSLIRKECLKEKQYIVIAQWGKHSFKVWDAEDKGSAPFAFFTVENGYLNHWIPNKYAPQFCSFKRYTRLNTRKVEWKTYKESDYH